MATRLVEGQSFAGLLVGREDDDWFVPATATLAQERGVRIDIPYLGGMAPDQFQRPRRWFREMSPPSTLEFHAPDGLVLSLFDLRWGGHTGAGVVVGTLYAREAIYGTRIGPREDLTVETLQSRMDGLYEWTEFRAATYQTIPDKNGFTRRIEGSVETIENMVWDQGDARMEITSTWRGGGDDGPPGLHFDEWTVLKSSFPEPRSISDHLEQQLIVRCLLTVLFGAEISFRQHDILDERFHPRHRDGRVYSRFGQEMVSARTFREYGRPRLTPEKLRKCVANLSQIGSDGLVRWAELFDPWQRVILPAVATFSRSRPVVEDKIVTLAMCLEAAGNLLGPQPGEESTYNQHTKRPPETTATWIYRCLAVTAIDWSRAAESTVGLARAAAKRYIHIKHYRDGGFPDGAETFLLSQAMEVTLRLLLASQVAPDGNLSANWQEIVEDTLQWFENERLVVRDDGSFVMLAN